MKFIVCLACVAAVATAENTGNERCLFGIIGQISQNLRLKPIAVENSIAVEHIVLDPFVVQKLEIDSYEPINVSPVIIDNIPLVRSPIEIPDCLYPLHPVPVFPLSVFRSPFVQFIVNVESGSGVSGRCHCIHTHRLAGTTPWLFWSASAG